MRISFTAVIGLVFTAIAVMSLSLSPAARLLPLMVSIPGMLLSMIALLREIRVPAVADDGEEQGSMTELKAAGWIFAFWAAVLLFGFLIGAPLVTAAYLPGAAAQCRGLYRRGACLLCRYLWPVRAIARCTAVPRPADAGLRFATGLGSARARSSQATARRVQPRLPRIRPRHSSAVQAC